MFASVSAPLFTPLSKKTPLRNLTFALKTFLVIQEINQPWCFLCLLAHHSELINCPLLQLQQFLWNQVCCNETISLGRACQKLVFSWADYRTSVVDVGEQWSNGRERSKKSWELALQDAYLNTYESDSIHLPKKIRPLSIYMHDVNINHFSNEKNSLVQNVQPHKFSVSNESW